MKIFHHFAITSEELKKLMESGESETVEFKASFGKEVLESACALANTKGGTILIGVTDRGEIKGTQVGKETLKDWVNQISQNSEPRLIPEIEVKDIKRKKVVLIWIKEFPVKPISVKGRYYRRVGTSNRIMPMHEIAEMHLQTTGMSWDKFPASNALIKNIDLEKVKSYIKKANDKGRRKIGSDEKPLQVLEKLELIKDGKPTWASVLLFNKQPQQYLSQSVIHCGRFKEETIVIDDRMIEGTLDEQIEEAMDFIRKNINVKFVMTGKPARDEIWDYPLEALREAVINAVCHRDYTISANTEIRIYDNELVVWNPGGLPLGLTIKDLYKPHPSILRNKGIGAVFYDLGLIEQWGSGIEKMRKVCANAGIPEPEFVENQGFRVVFRKDIYTEEFLRSIDFNERQIRAFGLIIQKGNISSKEYQQLTGVSRTTSTRELKIAVNKGILQMIGSKGRGIKYILKKPFAP